MRESDWLARLDPLPMLDFLAGKASDRKFRLYACADCRRVWEWFDQDAASRHGVEVAERYADGQASDADIATANQPLSGSVVFGATLPQADGVGGAWGVAYSICEAYSQSFDDDIEEASVAIKATQSGLVREIFGNPFRPLTLAPTYRTPAVISLARAAYDERHLPSGALDPHRLAVLADALEEVGAPGELVAHLRGPGPHVRGCFAVDLCLGLG